MTILMMIYNLLETPINYNHSNMSLLVKDSKSTSVSQKTLQGNYICQSKNSLAR